MESTTTKTGQYFSNLVDDPAFAAYLIEFYKEDILSSADFEAICRGYYGTSLYGSQDSEAKIEI